MDKLTRIDRARQAAQKAADLCRTAIAHLEAVEPESPAIGDLRPPPRNSTAPGRSYSPTAPPFARDRSPAPVSAAPPGSKE